VRTDSGLSWNLLDFSELSEDFSSAHRIAVVISEVSYDYLGLNGIPISDFF
jgi:hypothetical protein